MQASSNAPQPIRLWPGVTLVVLQWLSWLAVPRVVSDAGPLPILIAVGCGLAVALW